MPSNFRWVSIPSRSDSRGAWTSGVEPSISVTTGVVRRRAAAGRGSARSAATPASSAERSPASRDELLLDHPDRPRRRAQQLELRDLARRAALNRPSATGCMTITSRAFSPMPFCTTLFTLTPLSPRILRDLREHARAGPRPRGAGRRPTRPPRRGSNRSSSIGSRSMPWRAHHRDDVAEHGGRGLRPAGARARERHLGDRRRLERDRVERARPPRRADGRRRGSRGTRAR